MKLLVLTGLVLLASCSKKETSEQATDVNHVSSPVVADVSGQALIDGSDCMACHQVHERVIGPSYQEIAKKYSEKDIETLASKIIEGGSGVWGSVPMPAHPQVSKEEAKKMATYILSQKK